MHDLVMGDDADGTPVTNVINTIALHMCTDSRHRIHFRDYRGGGEVCSLTLAELDARVRNIALHLRALGVREQDRVGILADNSIEWVLLDLAVIKLGAVTAGFEPGRSDPGQLLRDYGLKLLFAEDVAVTGALRDIGVVTAWAEDALSGETFPFHGGYDPADILAIKCTSGSTGAPKGLETTVANVNSSLHEVQKLFTHEDGDNLLVPLGSWPLQQRFWIYSALVHGHDVTICRVEDALDMARRTAATVVMAVPAFYEQVKDRLENRGVPTAAEARRDVIQAEFGGRIRYLWTGAAPASRSVLEFFNNGGVPLYEGYGLNETCIVAKNHPGAFRLGSVGKVLPNKTVRFDRAGVLIVGSRHPVNQRYSWCAPGASEKMFLPSGEVKTYDIGHLDEDGYLYIHGRVDDVLTLSKGYNVLAPPIEEKLRDHPAIHDCVLYGNGRKFLSAVISMTSDELDDAGLSRHVAEVNEQLLGEQRVHAVVIATERFSIENGLLTGLFKPKRRAIHQRHERELTGIYREEPGTCPAAHRPLIIDASRPASHS
ncbi:AMP-binding protein (plasmid) [Streptomyces hirsutus]|uniref:AMP-binding protein n=1 Tax=Streptomyces hirsutus TaxID=35620 RepID=UPI002F908838|nr:AMP-binding protein [Streptomyces hirsutus]